MTPSQKKEAERYLVGQGLVMGGAAQYGGFLGMLASIGVPLAIDLVRKIIGKGLQTQPPRSRQRRTPPYHHLLKAKECKFDHHLSLELGMINYLKKKN